MTNIKEIIKEFRKRFSFIAYKGFQCDEITVANIEDFLSQALSSQREGIIKEIEGIKIPKHSFTCNKYQYKTVCDCGVDLVENFKKVAISNLKENG